MLGGLSEEAARGFEAICRRRIPLGVMSPQQARPVSLRPAYSGFALPRRLFQSVSSRASAQRLRSCGDRRGRACVR